VLPFFPEYAFALVTVRKGKYGKLLGGHFKRVISDPQWLPDYYKPDKIGGPLLDLHIHDAHFIRLLFGMPTAVFSRGRMRGEVVEFLESQFMCSDPAQVVTATSGVIRQQGRAFNHAYEIHLEKATLLFEFAVIDGKPHVTMPVTVLDDKGQVLRPELGAADPVDAFVAELKEVAKSVKSGKPSATLGGDLAADAIILCQRQAQSVMTGKLVKV
jgi:predicted dehydrogenase